VPCLDLIAADIYFIFNFNFIVVESFRHLLAVMLFSILKMLNLLLCIRFIALLCALP